MATDQLNPPLPVPPQAEGFWSAATQRLDSASTWAWAFSTLSGGFTLAAKGVQVIGPLNWAEAVILGVLLTAITTLSVTGSLALWRLFKPVPTGQIEKVIRISAAHGIVLAYRDNPANGFRRVLSTHATFFSLRRHLSPLFLEEVKSPNLDDEELVERYLAEIDRLAERWRVL